MKRALYDGIAALELPLPDAVCERLLAYAALLLKWNRVYNLTAIRAPQQVITHHLLDSLAVLPYLSDVATLADIGSGGGLPGIPLALANPALAVTSVESVGKKAGFQQQARIELALTNFAVMQDRVENVRPAALFDAVISRAFSELDDFVTLTRHLLRPRGRFIAMKGIYPHEEIERLPAGLAVVGVETLTIPGMDAERHLIFLESE